MITSDLITMDELYDCIDAKNLNIIDDYLLINININIGKRLRVIELNYPLTRVEKPREVLIDLIDKLNDEKNDCKILTDEINKLKRDKANDDCCCSIIGMIIGCLFIAIPILLFFIIK